MTSPTLLERVAAGDADAVREVLDTYSGLVWSMARRRLGAGPDAEDAVQEIFIEIWKSAGRFDPSKGNEAQFLSTIARRRLIDRIRRRQRAPTNEPLPEALPEAAGPDTVEIGDEAARARAALATLSPDQQRVLNLAVMGDYSHSEIAASTGMPLGTVKTHVRRGLIRIREILATDGEGPS